MVHKSMSENYLLRNNIKRDSSDRKQEKQKKSDVLVCKRIPKIDSVVTSLDTSSSIIESGQQQHDRQQMMLLMTTQKNNVKNQKLVYELEEARKENKQLLNVLQRQCTDQEGRTSGKSSESRRRQVDRVPSYSTMSMVHLQYKHEELLASHQGLLKVLEAKIKESQKCYRENDDLRDEVQKNLSQIADHETTIKRLCDKYLNLKQRKDKKIVNLRYERDTLRLVHRQLVSLLHKKCMDEDIILNAQLRSSSEPTKALLLNEVKLCNKLQHENARLSQENKILRSRLGLVEKKGRQ